MRPSCHSLSALALIRGGEQAPALCGTVNFQQKPCGVLVTAHVRGLPQNGQYFALHIHEGTSCSGIDFSDTGGHYNPEHALHPNHAGDLPPLLSCSGEAYLSMMTNRFCVEDILGRTVVIHSGPDDFHTQPAGNSGQKIACGVICRTC